MAAPLLSGVAFITGAGSGIGRATALAFAANGISALSINDINAEGLQGTVSELASKYPSVKVKDIVLDVTSQSDVDNAVAETVKDLGSLDVAVNCAGIGTLGLATHEMETEHWRKVLDINLDGVWNCMRAEIKVMRTQQDKGFREGRGKIINISSVLGQVGPPIGIKATPYAASKHAVMGLTKADATQYAAEGIRINAICPGWIETPMVSVMHQYNLMEAVVKRTPLGRTGRPEEIADCAVFLSSKLSSFVVGAGLMADGGITIN